MKKIACAAIVTMLLQLSVFAQTNALIGAWQPVEITKPDGKVVTGLEVGLYIFTQNHFSRTYWPDKPRPFLDADPAKRTNDQRLAAYDNYHANAGTYKVSGSTLTLQIMTAKNAQASYGPQVFEYRIEGDTLSIKSISGGPVQNVGSIYKLVRLKP